MEAFRKACLLFNKMSMVTFNIDSSTRRESLSAKGLSIRESVVWVNISREEFAIYTEVERLLSNAVKQKGLSPFLAVDLLICAATSVHALRRTAKTWASAGPRSVQVIGEQAHELFLELAHMMDSRLNEDLTCTKLQLTLYLGRQCLETKERLVIFTSSQDLLEEVHIFLTTRAVPQLDKTKVYTYDAPQHTSSQKNLPLEKFNTASDGAILIAPYGPIIHCMEESGWGFINATRVLFIDSSWHSGVSVQAVNRVHHFAQLSNVIHVHHFLARDTVEDELSSQLERRYKRMLSYDNLSETAISSVDERGFLTAPEVSSELIRDNPPQQISRSAKPSVKKLDTDEQDSSAIVAEQDEMVSRLKETWDPTNHEYYVHEIILCSNRYRMMSENLDLLMQSEWSKTPSFFTEVVDGAKFNNLIKLHRESLHTFGSYAIDAMGEGLGGEWLAQDCTYMEQDLRISYLLTSWEPYRRLFESTEVSDLPQLPQNRKEKRHRPYDEPGRHPKIFRHEEVL